MGRWGGWQTNTSPVACHLSPCIHSRTHNISSWSGGASCTFHPPAQHKDEPNSVAPNKDPEWNSLYLFHLSMMMLFFRFSLSLCLFVSCSLYLSHVQAFLVFEPSFYFAPNLFVKWRHLFVLLTLVHMNKTRNWEYSRVMSPSSTQVSSTKMMPVCYIANFREKKNEQRSYWCTHIILCHQLKKVHAFLPHIKFHFHRHL